MMSESIDQLAAALVAAQGAFPKVGKSETGKISGKNAKGEFYSYEYKYADLAGIVGAVAEHLTANGLAVSQWPSSGAMGASLTTRLLHSSGQWMEDEMPLCAGQSPTPQQLGSAITYARRYAYCAALGIVTDDDDGQAASQRPSAGDAFEAAVPVARDPRVVLGIALKQTAEAGGKAELEDFFAEWGIPKKPAEMTDDQMVKVQGKLAEMADA